MGFCRSVFNALLGPMVIYAALMAHVMYNHFIMAPGPLSMTDFSADVPKDLREATIKSRKALIKSHLDVFTCKTNTAAYAKSYLTEDFTIEDPLQFVDDLDAFSGIFKFFCKGVDSGEFDVRGEHHGPNEIVLDLTYSYKMDLFGLKFGPLSVSMNQFIMLEPPSKTGDKEKVFSVREDWGGNRILSEENAPLKQVGRIHKMLRKFVGFVATKIAAAAA